MGLGGLRILTEEDVTRSSKVRNGLESNAYCAGGLLLAVVNGDEGVVEAFGEGDIVSHRSRSSRKSSSVEGVPGATGRRRLLIV